MCVEVVFFLVLVFLLLNSCWSVGSGWSLRGFGVVERLVLFGEEIILRLYCVVIRNEVGVWREKVGFVLYDFGEYFFLFLFYLEKLRFRFILLESVRICLYCFLGGDSGFIFYWGLS